MTVRRKNGSLFILFGALLLVTGLSFTGAGGAAAAGFIAGLEPDKRRADVPIITEVKRDAVWQARALTGISKPYPEHVLQFLKDQGNWFSPFLHPGMVNRYDIRGWHKSKKD
jgi:hypothetical protein